MKPSEIVTSAEKITSSIRTRFKRYKSISIVLLIAVFVLGAAIAAIEYFKNTTTEEADRDEDEPRIQPLIGSSAAVLSRSIHD